MVLPSGNDDETPDGCAVQLKVGKEQAEPSSVSTGH